jgi:hypothetical protein
MLPHPSIGDFELKTAQFQYEPYPIGYCPQVFSGALYTELLNNWPDVSLFQFKPELGNKYSLSEVNRPDDYHRFVRETACWRALHERIKSANFIHHVADFLASHRVDLGLKRSRVFNSDPQASAFARAVHALRRRRSRLKGHKCLSSRFEFSMLPAAGGNILPHTDAPGKIITLVLSMCAPGEWDERWGGGTTVLKPIDRSRSFNWFNHQLAFDDCEVVHTYPFEPNQCVLFVKTYNSLHAVDPMTGPDKVMRRTLTINIEELS